MLPLTHRLSVGGGSLVLAQEHKIVRESGGSTTSSKDGGVMLHLRPTLGMVPKPRTVRL